MHVVRIDGDGEARGLTPGEIAETDQQAAGIRQRASQLADYMYDASQAAHDGDTTRSAATTAELLTTLEQVYADKTETLNLICYLVGEHCEAMRYVENVAQDAATIIGIVSNVLPAELRLPLQRLFEYRQQQEEQGNV